MNNKGISSVDLIVGFCILIGAIYVTNKGVEQYQAKKKPAQTYEKEQKQCLETCQHKEFYLSEYNPETGCCTCSNSFSFPMETE